MKSKRYILHPETGHLQAVWRAQPTDQEFIRIASRLPVKLLIEAAGNGNQLAAVELNRRIVSERVGTLGRWENIEVYLQEN